MVKVYELTQHFLRETKDASWAIERHRDGLEVVSSHADRKLFPKIAVNLAGLRAIAAEYPAVFTVEALAHNTVTSSETVRALLPLLLAPSHPTPQLTEDDLVDDEIKALYTSMEDTGGPKGWLLEVNNEPWATWDGLAFLPGDELYDLFNSVTEWATFLVEESASMTSGSDSSRIGEWSHAVGLELTTWDEDEVFLRVFEITEPAMHVIEWAQDNELVRQWAGLQGRERNGTLFNALVERMINPESGEMFPNLAVFRSEEQAADSTCLGSNQLTEFDPSSSLECSVYTPDPRSEIGAKIAKRLRRDYSDWPYFQVVSKDDGETDSDIDGDEESAIGPRIPTSKKAYSKYIGKLLDEIRGAINSSEFGKANEELATLLATDRKGLPRVCLTRLGCDS